jgi:hypothetical protein
MSPQTVLSLQYENCDQNEQDIWVQDYVTEQMTVKLTEPHSDVSVKIFINYTVIKVINNTV